MYPTSVTSPARPRLLLWALAACLPWLCGSPASAAEASEASASHASANDWEVAVTPYIWIAGTSGEIGIPRRFSEVEIDRNFSDVLGNLKFAFMGAIDVRYRRFVSLADVVYVSAGVEAEGIADPQFFSGKVDASVLASTVAAGYRVVDNGPMFIDLLAGARFVSIDTELLLEGPLATRQAEKSASTVAPLLAARMRVPLADNWALGLYGDAGGLGLVASDIKWQLLGTVQWDISRHWRLLAGYRHMDIHHDKADYEFDLSLSGPIVGISYRF